MARVPLRSGRLDVALVVVLAGALGTVGCRDEPPAPSAPERSAPTVAAEGGYELDVIAEAEPDEGAPPLTVRFSGYVEEDEGGPWRFQWDFGDGASSREQNPVHTYEAEGDYTAALTATDRSGNTGTDEIDVFVETED